MASNLEEIEQIKQLKARYFRLMDTRQWDAWRSCFSADIVASYDGPPRLDMTAPTDPITCHGVDALVAGVSGLFVTARSIHQGYMPEIELTSPITAKGIWSMWDFIRSPKGTFQGWGHYHEDYVKEDGVWKIKRIKLTRLHTAETWSELI
ncbi:MAG: nuclear transport factor 2 family protein [Gammaproteobacteria bacterium]|nr:nuclear transport factor 2 family protein [Gammaproteobacteria bacterium]